MRRLPLLLAAAIAAGAAPAAARPSVTLNGVNIDGVTGQRFENCTVVIDANGDVHIEAKGYAVQGAEPARPPAPAVAATAAPAAVPPAAPPAALPPPAASPPPAQGRPPPVADARTAPPKLARRYFLATEQSAPDATPYDVAIFINAQWIREVKSSEPQVVMEVTRYLRPGANKVVLAATRRGAGERLADPAATLKVVLGAGNVGGGHVMIDEPLVEMVRTAADAQDRTEEYVLEAR
jgi:hypothetical protein